EARALVRRLARDPRWETRLAVSPDREGMESRVWPAGLARTPQGRGDLGARMARALRAAPPGPVVLIGADIPGVGPAQIARAFAALGRAEAVFGPAEDGGFWLAGLARRRGVPPGLFAGARWSTGHALADARATLGGRRVALIDRLGDVDEAADLDRLGLPRPWP
ncbi:MAG: TIGR04282 family arsenosugar biosynthesis glycosyltransferase, partial [Pseudomonadota bacterium]